MATKVGKGYEKSLTPASVLVDDLKSEELSRRINSVKNLNVIAAALGPDRTKSELIPFLSGISWFLSVQYLSVIIKNYMMMKMRY